MIEDLRRNPLMILADESLLLSYYLNPNLNSRSITESKELTTYNERKVEVEELAD